MVNSTRNILFIFEGEVDEVALFKQIERVYFHNYGLKFEIYTYKTSIYELYDELCINDEYIDIISILLSKENDQEMITKLSQKFTDIYLIFDYDPHYHKFDKEKIVKMLTLFNDSMENGKLYINYPMIQSYKHLMSVPDFNYRTYYVNLCDCHEYKAYINDISFNCNVQKYDLKIMNEVIKHNIRKCNYLLNYKFEDVGYNEYVDFSMNEILNIQNKNLNIERIFILNTSVFFAIDYTGNDKIFRLILNA